MFHGYHDARRSLLGPCNNNGKRMHPLAIKARGCTALKEEERKGMREEKKRKQEGDIKEKREQREKEKTEGGKSFEKNERNRETGK